MSVKCERADSCPYTKCRHSETHIWRSNCAKAPCTKRQIRCACGPTHEDTRCIVSAQDFKAEAE